MDLRIGNSGIIFDIKKFAVHDGPGIRTTVFFKGCPLTCWWCHNPESQNFKLEQFINPKNEDNGRDNFKIIGKNLTVKEVFKEVEKDIIFYDESGGGVTFSGGEPLSQPEFLLSLLKLCRINKIHTVLDTSGYTTEDIINNIKEYVDLFLYDLKFHDSEKHEKFTGVPNQQILNNLIKLSENGSKIIIRIPIIPGINDDSDELNKIRYFISNLKNIQGIDLLPFHKIGKNKYIKLNLPYLMEDFNEPSHEQMEKIKLKFDSINIPVKIGG
ncbi:glycyl-radical enzyme activating protein [Promethearchaeum syntrophicum]|uniref:Glycyl-radical enzyme activating protein n=1 Tax=Promethearchaeum syntrophicum TaxID=2594042 RepID=A0A5B9DE48_9ARCH|nr:glycyl-radical enzyme activating protein [Candidatus Prometheoarchaeum syntrophicum]QEE17271.1 pyruvate formate lyase II activase [Candidatus Prometheoarchaeum syntrophicum]